MQNDLISRSTVEKMIHDYFINCVENGKYEVDVTEVNAELQEKLNKLSKAYDAEKVCEQLGEKSFDINVKYTPIGKSYPTSVISLETAVEIVCNGGKE